MTVLKPSVAIVEILPFFLEEERICRILPDDSDSWHVGLESLAHPGDVARDACGQLADVPMTVHSTSWRFEEERLIFTYVAVFREAKGHVSGFRAAVV